ncbi:hypothetical protein SAMN04489866_10217 [Peptococcus niger]|uniref:Uncharacterized protein n=1 Tax=Peptococcus niger TaxID=2741 RepID=A0A1G6T0M9_PEPNI|nr:hypothetical protein SAMN04489866_10217 [Peptococcus niger]
MAGGKQGLACLDGLQANHCRAGVSSPPFAGRKIILARALTSWVLVARMNLY